MKKFWISTAVAAIVVLAFAGFTTRADDDAIVFGTRLSGFQETPAILTEGHGFFRGVLDGDTVHYELSFADLSTETRVAHIHFGQRGVAGAVFIFLCGGGGQADCPAGGGTVTGSFGAANIIGVPAQGIPAGDFRAAVRLLRTGLTYVNVHTVSHPGGEIRGQLRAFREDDDRE